MLLLIRLIIVQLLHKTCNKVFFGVVLMLKTVSVKLLMGQKQTRLENPSLVVNYIWCTGIALYGTQGTHLQSVRLSLLVKSYAHNVKSSLDSKYVCSSTLSHRSIVWKCIMQTFVILLKKTWSQLEKSTSKNCSHIKQVLNSSVQFLYRTFKYTTSSHVKLQHIVRNFAYKKS